MPEKNERKLEKKQMKIFSITGTRIIIENDKNELITAMGHKTFEGFCIEKDSFECLKPMLKTLAEYEKIDLIQGIKNDKILSQKITFREDNI